MASEFSQTCCGCRSPTLAKQCFEWAGRRRSPLGSLGACRVRHEKCRVLETTASKRRSDRRKSTMRLFGFRVRDPQRDRAADFKRIHRLSASFVDLMTGIEAEKRRPSGPPPASGGRCGIFIGGAGERRASRNVFAGQRTDRHDDQILRTYRVSQEPCGVHQRSANTHGIVCQGERRRGTDAARGSWRVFDVVHRSKQLSHRN
jgi:hypothetical protein